MATPTTKTQEVGAYLLIFATKKIIAEKLPAEYQKSDDGDFCEWEWDIKKRTPNYLEVWNTRNRTDVPFKYIPTEEEKTQMEKIFKMINPQKFTNLFTPESIKASEADFDYFIGRMVKDGADHATIERFHEIYYDCKKWATGEHATDRNMNFTFDIKDTTQEEFEDMIEMYYSKSRLFCYLLSTYNKGKSITDEGNNDFQRFFNELPSNGFQIIRQLVIDEKKGERVGYIGIYSNEEWNALMNKSKKIVMCRDEKQKKGEKLCACGCGTFQKKLMKASCCGARYVNAEHQKEHWAEHKKECKKTGLPSK